MTMKLNLGCGFFKKEGYINVDSNPDMYPDILYDLNVEPYPFPADHFELIEADHVIEHLDRPFDIMKEIHRILKNNGMLKIKVPHFSRGFTHPDHRRGFDVSFPYYFRPFFKPGYVGVEYELKRQKLIWFAQPHVKRMVFSKPVYYIGFIFGTAIDFIANMFPFLFSRVLCFWVGGFEEIEFHFICKKNTKPGTEI